MTRRHPLPHGRSRLRPRTPGWTGAARSTLLAFLAVLAALVPAVGGATPTAAAEPVARPPWDLAAEYYVALHLEWATGAVRLRTDIEVRNTSGAPVDRVRLNTVVAVLGDMRSLRVRVDGAAVAARVRGQTISVPFPEPLTADATSRIRVSFRGRLTDGTSGREFLWARQDGRVQMYRFIPWLSRLIPFGRQPHGEPFVTGVSPRVRVSLSSDRDVTWATSGQRVSRDGRTSVFEAADVRDFAVAASPAYRTRSGRSLDGETRISVHASRGDRARLLRLAQLELQRYERITGVDYPYPAFRIAQTSTGLPMEAPAMIWIPAGRSSYEWPFLVSHEMAHQWFYAIVGNDQASDAFADEAMADYFSRRAHLSLRPSRCALDRLDRDIRGYSTSCYYEVIYVQGARFLAGLRRDFGAGAFRRAVRAYTRDYRLGLGGNQRLLEAFRDQMGNGVLERYRVRFPSLY